MEKTSKSTLSYDKLKEFYLEHLSITGLSAEDLGKLYHYVGYIYLAQKVKNPDVTLYYVLSKILKIKRISENGEFIYESPKESTLDYFIIPFSIQLEVLIEQNEFKPQSLGCTTAKDIVNNINEIFDKWIPF